MQHRVDGFSERWLLWEEKVPESAWHFSAILTLYTVLLPWAERRGRNAAVFMHASRRWKPS